MTTRTRPLPLPSFDRHAFGTVLPANCDVPTALTLAGLAWDVELAPLAVTATYDAGPLRARLAAAGLSEADVEEIVALAPARVPTASSSSFAVRRTDTGTVLGTVGRTFRPITNRQAFQWVQPLVDAGLVRLDAAGSTREGSRVWIRAEILGGDGDEVEVAAGDPVKPSILFAHGHDGGLAVRVGLAATRFLCTNAMAAALGASPDLYTVRHTAGALVALDAIRNVITAGIQGFRVTASAFGELAEKACSDALFERYVRAVFALKPDADAPRIMARLRQAYTDAPGARPGTWWGAYNAVTYYLTHMRGSDATRHDALMFGNSRVLLSLALSLALEASMWVDETAPVSIVVPGLTPDDVVDADVVDTADTYGRVLCTFGGILDDADSDEPPVGAPADDDYDDVARRWADVWAELDAAESQDLGDD